MGGRTERARGCGAAVGKGGRGGHREVEGGREGGSKLRGCGAEGWSEWEERWEVERGKGGEGPRKRGGVGKGREGGRETGSNGGERGGGSREGKVGREGGRLYEERGVGVGRVGRDEGMGGEGGGGAVGGAR